MLLLLLLLKAGACRHVALFVNPVYERGHADTELAANLESASTFVCVSVSAAGGVGRGSW